MPDRTRSGLGLTCRLRLTKVWRMTSSKENLASELKTGPLDGVRVLEAGLLVQGPQASLTMQEWGADVIKVELPGFGDQARWLPIGREIGARRSSPPTTGVNGA